MTTSNPSQAEGERRSPAEDEQDSRRAPETQTTPSQAEGERDEEEEDLQ